MPAYPQDRIVMIHGYAFKVRRVRDGRIRKRGHGASFHNAPYIRIPNYVIFCPDGRFCNRVFRWQLRAYVRYHALERMKRETKNAQG